MSLTTPHAPASTISDAHWQTLVDRNAEADGSFVYGVKSTGIYCRPSCPSRAPNRRNVVSFATAKDAEAAGFRGCYRCNPNGVSVNEASAKLVAEACRTIEAADAMPTLAELAAAAGLSPFHFHRRFKAMTGLTPKAYGAAQRAKRVRAELAQNGASVTSALYGAGFGSSSRFYEKSSEVLGMTPTAFKQGGKDADIRFAVGQSSLGRDPRRAQQQGDLCDHPWRRPAGADRGPRRPVPEGEAHWRRR